MASDNSTVGSYQPKEIVVRPWLSRLTYKQQTVLLSAIRGCDGVPKEDPSKQLVRALRQTVLRDAVPDQSGDGKFMREVSEKRVQEYLKNPDAYPMHWLVHFTHAVEIIGYKHPDEQTREWWYGLYLDIVDMLHFNPETEREMDERLEDGVETTCWKSYSERELHTEGNREAEDAG